MNRAILLLSVAILVGCGSNSAVDRTENYTYAWPNINYEVTDELEIGVIDNREYVVSGKVKPTYVGIMRASFGNPWYMYTESGNPLSNDISQAVLSGFQNSGNTVKDINLNSTASVNLAERAFSSTDSAKKLLIIINQWKSDTYGSTSFIYNLTVNVYGQVGQKLASHTVESVAGETAVASPLDAGRRALTDALNAKPIVNALKQPAQESGI